MCGAATVLKDYAYPTPVSWGYPMLHIYCLSQNRSVAEKWRALTSSGDEVWLPTDGSLLSLPGYISPSEPFIAANVRGVGYVDLFVLGGEHALYHKYWDGSWHPGQWGYYYRGEVLTSSPTVVSWSKDRQDVFFIGSPQGVGLYDAYTNRNGWS